MHSLLPPLFNQINFTFLPPSFTSIFSPSPSLPRVTPRLQLIDDEKNLPRTGSLLKTGQHVLSVGAKRGTEGIRKRAAPSYPYFLLRFLFQSQTLNFLTVFPSFLIFSPRFFPFFSSERAPCHQGDCRMETK